LTRRMFALMLILFLSGNCLVHAQPSGGPVPKEQVRAMAANSQVEVKFIDGSRQRGRISEVSDTGFVLNRERNNQIEKSQVAFVQIKTVKQVKDVKSHKTRNILVGVAIGVGIGIVVLVVIGEGMAKLQGRTT
jgi:hypothetical protein